MYEFSRRAFLKFLGKITAALGMVFSLGPGCAKEEGKEEPESELGTTQDWYTTWTKKHGITLEERYERAKNLPKGPKKIIGLSCGSEMGQNETFIRAAALGAAEFGIETELIRAATLEVTPLEGNLEDDTDWINDKLIMEDHAVICAVPCYHTRANGLSYCICERSLTIFRKYPELLKKNQVGAVIGVGASGYDAWASLTNLSTQIYMQHFCKVVDQVLYTFSGFREYNLWMQQDQPLTSNTHLNRVEDTDWDVSRTMWGEQVGFAEWYRMAIERAKELGRNVARAMNRPIEEVKYVGEEAGVACPLCHCNILCVPENLPYVYCPICMIRGTVTDDNGKMGVEWNMKDLERPRFCMESFLHHFDYSRQSGESRRKSGYQDEVDEIKNSVYSESEVKIISPYV
jgi:multimeric flavodoxin WrbA